ncbi:predicted protein [Naegleria gruberi]|uniref:Predicted protein n=1 Tax=Naegleria gruberi TaxID=5762 RepID=D2W3R9_NAEGR|nr:uncharacterized protein NAEGRDRAFT_82266 [Naegleria gruberi]EFC36285.1 predicted protein [Naegleria gruberi]|eukprot:XP_002669029.1 predicted protein [Naegleria gruberi strain NEG-M]
MFLSAAEGKSSSKSASHGSLHNQGGNNNNGGVVAMSKLTVMNSSRGLGLLSSSKRSSSYGDEFYRQYDQDSNNSNNLMITTTTTSNVVPGSPNMKGSVGVGGLYYANSVLNNNFEWSYKVETQKDGRKRANSFKDLCFMLPLLSIINTSAFNVVMQNAGQLLGTNSENGNIYTNDKSLFTVYHQIDRELSKSLTGDAVSPATSSPINAILMPNSPGSSQDVLSDCNSDLVLSIPNSPSSGSLHLYMESQQKQHSPSESNSNILNLREKFILFIVNNHPNHLGKQFTMHAHLKEGISGKQLAEVSVRTKLMFLDLFYGCSRVHAKKPIQNCTDIVVLLEQLTYNLVRTSGDVILEEMDIDMMNHMVEQQTSLPYYRHMSEAKNFDCVQNERLKNFLNNTFSRIFKSPDESENQDSIFAELLLEIRYISDMIYLEMEDIYSIFQSIAPFKEAVEEFLGKGIQENTLPMHIVQMYKKKLEEEKAFQTEKNHLLLRDQDFQAKNIIDKDWNLVKHLSRGHATDWKVVHSQSHNEYKKKHLKSQNNDEQLINLFPYSMIVYNTKRPYHTGIDSKDLKSSKMVTTLDYSIEQVAKTFGHDYALSEEFSEVEFTEFIPLNESNSLHKYPSFTFNASVELGSSSKKKKMEGILSTKISLVNTPGRGNELNEICFVYKSCQASSNKKESIIIWCARVFTRIDNHRTRLFQFKLSNIGSLSSSFLSSSKAFLKKNISEDHSRILKELQSAEKDEFPTPSESNHIMRTMRDYCLHYHNTELKDLIRNN